MAMQEIINKISQGHHIEERKEQFQMRLMQREECKSANERRNSMIEQNIQVLEHNVSREGAEDSDSSIEAEQYQSLPQPEELSLNELQKNQIKSKSDI